MWLSHRRRGGPGLRGIWHRRGLLIHESFARFAAVLERLRGRRLDRDVEFTQTTMLWDDADKGSLATGKELRWVWDPQPGRTYIIRVENPIRRLVYRLATFLGWRPILPSTNAPPGEPSDDGLQGAGVPRRPLNSPGSASVKAEPPEAEPRDISKR